MLHFWKRPSSRDLKALEAVGKPCLKPFDSDLLRIIAFSDYRVQDITLLLEFIKTVDPKPNLILYGGDDVERFHANDRNVFEELASLSTHGLCAVLGNDPPENDQGQEDEIQAIPDTKTLRSYIRGTNVHNVHETPLVIGKYAVIGSEGSPPDEKLGNLGVVIYSEESIARHLKLALKTLSDKLVIVLSHCPPREVLDFAIRFGRRNIGSTALRQFLQHEKKVPLVVCGHVHFSGAQSQEFAGSLVVNAASHDNFGAPGRIAIIDIRAAKVCNLQWHDLWELFSVSGIKESRAAMLNAAGIKNVNQLADAPAECIKKALNCGAGEAASIKARATALLRQDAIICKPLEVPTMSSRAYIDIETDPNSKFIWLVGLHIHKEGKTHSFFAHTPADEKQMLMELLDFLNARTDLQLLNYSNSTVEQRLLPKRFSAHGLPTDPVQHIQDIYYAIHASCAFPVETSTLKDISRWCGFKPRHPDLDGWAAALSYGAGKPNKQLKTKLLAYNEDDLLALKHVVEYIETRSNNLSMPIRAVSALISS